MKHDLVSSFDR